MNAVLELQKLANDTDG
ncbi:class III lanthipeptide, partial [Bacillus pretiosus]